MVYKWTPDKHLDSPIYLQLAKYLRDKILVGLLKNGTKLPSIKRMVSMLNVSKSTVNSAYTLLLEERLIVSFPRSGFIVAERLDNNTPDWRGYIRRSKHRAGVDVYRHWAEVDGLPGFGLSSNFNIMPYISSALNVAIQKLDRRKPGIDITKYGLTSLRESLAVHLKTLGINADIENILITSETFQRLFIIYESLMNTGSSLFYENPNIITTVSNIHSIGMNMIPITMDAYGLSVSELEKHLVRSQHSMLHIDSSDQAPTGIVMSRKRRYELMELVGRHKLPVVEIDAFEQVWNDGKAPMPLKSLDKHNNVIYLSSFIKAFPFDFQVSWIVADRYVIEYLSNVYMENGSRANILVQLAADEMFRSGMFDHMMRDIRTFVKARREHALELCHKHLRHIGEWKENNCWFHFWLNFPEADIKRAFSREMHNSFYPGFFFDRNDTNHVLLCPSSIPEEMLEQSIIQIVRATSS